MRITSKGQVTIPMPLRVLFGLLPHSEVEMVEYEEGVMIRKKEQANLRGKKLIQHMARTSTVNMTTDEIMELTRGDND